MKVLLVAKTFRRGGAASGAKNLFKALSSQGCEVIKFDCSDVGKFKRLIRGLERLLDWVFLGKEFHFFKLFKSSISLKNLERRYAPDIIQLCDVSGNLISFSEVDSLSCPVVHRMSDFWPYEGHAHYGSITEINYKGRFVRSIFSLLVFNTVPRNLWRVAPSVWLKDNLSNNKNVSVIKNAVGKSLASFKAVSGRKIKLGYIGNPVMLSRKGFMPLVRFLELLTDIPFGFELNVWGDVKGDNKVVSEYFDINYLGVYTSADLPRVYESIDILICPSRLDNSPNVVTEALSIGVPVVGQINTGMSTYLEFPFGALCDFWIDSESERSKFVAIIERFINDYARCSESAVEFVNTNLAYGVIGKEYIKLYKYLLNRVAD